MDGNGIITGTRWFFGNSLVSQSNTALRYSTNTVPSRLIIDAPFTSSDAGTYTCSPNSTFPTIPPGDSITLSAGGECVCIILLLILLSSTYVHTTSVTT